MLQARSLPCICIHSTPQLIRQAPVWVRCGISSRSSPLPIRQLRIARASQQASAEGDASQPQPSPSDCSDAREAIAAGIELFKGKKYEQAVEFFEQALDLPGTGTKRFRDKPPVVSAGEKQAILYNLACCYSQTGEVHTGLQAMAGCLENGYNNVDQLRSDPDLAELRKDQRFEGLIKRLVPLASSGLVGRFLNNLSISKAERR